LTHASTLTIARRFCGPTGIANGGYLCGALAAFAPGPATVRLAKPVPLETALVIERTAGWPYARHGETVLAEARSGTLGDLEPPARPSHAAATAAAQSYPGFLRHPAPVCFVCGPRRKPGDGLCIYSGSIAAGIVAAPWTPDSTLDSGDGCVRPEFMWAALDCPGFVAAAPDMRPMLLGELTAGIVRRARVGEPCVVVGWQIASSGRKHEAGTAVLADGHVLATARAIWIEPRAPAQ
jgi:hypothetical protein